MFHVFPFQYTLSAASEEQEKHGEAGIIAQRTFSAIRTVVSFGGEYKEMKKYVATNIDGVQ